MASRTQANPGQSDGQWCWGRGSALPVCSAPISALPMGSHTSKVTTTPPHARGAPAPHDENAPTYTQADERTQFTKLRSDTHPQAPKASALPHGLPHGPHPSGCTPTPASSPSHVHTWHSPPPRGSGRCRGQAWCGKDPRGPRAWPEPGITPPDHNPFPRSPGLPTPANRGLTREQEVGLPGPHQFHWPRARSLLL